MRYLLLLNMLLNWNILYYGIFQTIETNAYLSQRVQKIEEKGEADNRPGEQSNGIGNDKTIKKEEDIPIIKRVEVSDKTTVKLQGDIVRVESNKKPISTINVSPKNSIRNCAYWDSRIEKYGRNSKEEIWAKRVMRCESGCNPYAVNKSSGASGLFQFIVKWHPSMAGKVFNGDESIKYALYKYRLGGAGIWVCK